MANLIIPLLMAYRTFMTFNVGTFCDLERYSFGQSQEKIYFSDDVAENPVNELNSTYYVLPDGNVKLTSLGFPIDYLLRMRHEQFLVNIPNMKFPTSAAVMFVTEYKTVEQSVEEYAEPIPDWRKRLQNFRRNSRRNATHYIDRVVLGGRAISFLSIDSNVTGDIQIIRKTLQQVMGTTGTVDEGTEGLWKAAVKAVNESKDVRGKLRINSVIYKQNVGTPYNFVSLFSYLLEFTKYVNKKPYTDGVPLYVSLKSLQDFDENVPLLEKNRESEAYLKELQVVSNDVAFARNQIALRRVPEEFTDLATAFLNDVQPLNIDLMNLMDARLSIYNEVNASKFQEVFEKYQQGLLDSVQNYITAFHRLEERIVIKFADEFLTPTRGLLLVESKEVLPKRNASSAEECQKLGIKFKRCRAVAYSEEEKQCIVYLRSTYSAKVIFPEDVPSTYVIYDRRRAPN